VYARALVVLMMHALTHARRDDVPRTFPGRSVREGNRLGRRERGRTWYARSSSLSFSP
jgi:hypothetical protein